MTLGAILAAIGTVGAIVTGIVYLVKTGFWEFTKTADQTNQEIDQQEQKNKQDAENSGRPV